MPQPRGPFFGSQFLDDPAEYFLAHVPVDTENNEQAAIGKLKLFVRARDEEVGVEVIKRLVVEAEGQYFS